MLDAGTLGHPVGLPNLTHQNANFAFATDHGVLVTGDRVYVQSFNFSNAFKQIGVVENAIFNGPLGVDVSIIRLIGNYFVPPHGAGISINNFFAYRNPSIAHATTIARSGIHTNEIVNTTASSSWENRATGERVNFHNLIQTTNFNNRIQPGDSGSALLQHDGRVIGTLASGTTSATLPNYVFFIQAPRYRHLHMEVPAPPDRVTWLGGNYLSAVVNGRQLTNGAYLVDVPNFWPMVVDFNASGVGRITGMQPNGEIITLRDGSIRLTFSGSPLTSVPLISEDDGNLWIEAAEHNGGPVSGIMFYDYHRAVTNRRISIARPRWAWGAQGFFPDSVRPNFNAQGIMSFPENVSEYVGGRFYIDGASRTGFHWLANQGVVAYFNRDNRDLRQMSDTVSRTIDAELISMLRTHLSAWMNPGNNINDFVIGGIATYSFTNGGLVHISTQPRRSGLFEVEDEYAIDVLIYAELELDHERIINNDRFIPIDMESMNIRPSTIRINADGSLRINPSMSAETGFFSLTESIPFMSIDSATPLADHVAIHAPHILDISIVNAILQSE